MRDAALQECIDYLLPRVAGLRQQRGPDDDTVRRLAKALAAMTGASAQTTPTGKRRSHAGKKRSKDWRLPGGQPIDIWYDPANVREEGEP